MDLNEFFLAVSSVGLVLLPAAVVLGWLICMRFFYNLGRRHERELPSGRDIQEYINHAAVLAAEDVPAVYRNAVVVSIPKSGQAVLFVTTSVPVSIEKTRQIVDQMCGISDETCGPPRPVSKAELCTAAADYLQGMARFIREIEPPTKEAKH